MNNTLNELNEQQVTFSSSCHIKFTHLQTFENVCFKISLNTIVSRNLKK